MSIDDADHRTYAWIRNLDHGGFEHAEVQRHGRALRIRGEILAVHEGRPLRVAYTVDTDDLGLSRSAVVDQEFAGEWTRLVLVRDADGWQVDGRRAPELADCTDIDLGLSPSTNALPLSRLASQDPGRATVQAAWVRFPGLTVTAATQAYTPIGPGRWRYESHASGFRAELLVDDWHLPVDYEGVWTQVGRVDRPRPPSAAGGFAQALVAEAPSPGLGVAADDFDWLIGGWHARVRDFSDDGSVHEARGEWWFSWVLEGRAIQDVWISPPRDERGLSRGGTALRDRYGTTIRRFDRAAGEWRISWINPVTGAESRLSGTRQGSDIVLLGTEEGRLVKWQFVDIASDRFTWQGYRLEPDGETWRLEAEFELRRVDGADG